MLSSPALLLLSLGFMVGLGRNFIESDISSVPRLSSVVGLLIAASWGLIVITQFASTWGRWL